MTPKPESWVPLEANPDVVSRYLARLGVRGVHAVDVLSLEPEGLAWLPAPVRALLLLFPCTPAYEQHKASEALALAAAPATPPSLLFLRQHVRNACGTVALVHAAANWAASQPLEAGCLKNYLEAARSLDPEARGHLLEADEGVLTAHRELAAAGQSAAPNADNSSDHHFVALVPQAGRLYELDGRKVAPVDHGPTDDDSFLEDAAKICKVFVARDPENVNFSVIALTEGAE